MISALVLHGYLYAVLQEPHNNYKETYHPAYDIIDIQPEGFEARITGMAFLSDGRMVISTRYQGVNGAPYIGRRRRILEYIDLVYLEQFWYRPRFKHSVPGVIH